jgi:hypothetical protein
MRLAVRPARPCAIGDCIAEMVTYGPWDNIISIVHLGSAGRDVLLRELGDGDGSSDADIAVPAEHAEHERERRWVPGCDGCGTIGQWMARGRRA